MNSDLIENLHTEERYDISDLTLKLWGIEIVSGGSGFKLPRQLTVPNALIILLSGDGVLERDDKKSSMLPNYVYICPAEGTFGVTGGDGGELSFAIIRFSLFQAALRSRKRMNAVDITKLLPSLGELAIAPAGKLNAICRTMHEHSVSKDKLKRWRAQLDCQELMYEMIAAAGHKQPKEDSRYSVERAKAFMEKSFKEDLTIERLAGIAELSPKYFAELFKKTYGSSALDYLSHIRMNKAKQLMLRPRMLLRDVAHEIGYDDEFYFSRKFKKQFGMSPTAFLKKRERKIALYGSAALIGYFMPLHIIPYAAPLHPKWSGYYYEQLQADISVHLDAYRHNHNRLANLEKLAQSKPELIICPAGLEDWERKQLADIAEVFEMPPNNAGWRHQLLVLADFLGVESEGKSWIAGFDHKASLASSSLMPQMADKSVLSVRFIKNRLYAHCSQGIYDVLHEGLQLRCPYEKEKGPFDWPISLEELDTCRADYVLLVICQESETLESWKKLQQSPEWLSLHIIRENKLRIIPSEPWREYSPIALERMLEEAALLFSEKCP